MCTVACYRELETEAQVTEPDLALIAHQDIGAFDVPMEDTLIVEIRQSTEQTLNHRFELTVIQFHFHPDQS